MDLSNLSQLQTEGVNPRTSHIDRLSTIQMCTVINADDHLVAESIAPCLPVIADAIDALTPRVRDGGRVVYVGAGTSGRLGILDASEIPPTFAAPRSQFVGLIAGGDAAIREAQEGAEDNEQAGEADLVSLNLDPARDCVIGIASSGRTPYVLGCLAFAKRLGCLTIGVACAAPSAMASSGNVDYLIAPLPGPEVITGSTRLKAGTATKLVLNMLSTGTMIRTGKTYGNMMVDMVASNLKLKQRSRNMLRKLSPKCGGWSDSELDALLVKCNGSVKLAILTAETGQSAEDCARQLECVGGVLSEALIRPEGPHWSAMPARKFVLCVDGGGTKCAAVVADDTGVIGRGSAGPCNLTDNIGGMDGAMATLFDTIKSALEDQLPAGAEFTESMWKEYIRTCFHSVWIGLAGLDRAGFSVNLAPKLEELFGLDYNAGQIRLTNDVDLLTAAVATSHHAPAAVVLIAGTGSVAMRYTWAAKQGFVRVARSGGWGHLLGDEGGGYAIGLEAIKHTLVVLEEIALGLRTQEFGELEEGVVQQLGCRAIADSNIDLLNAVLCHRSDKSVKARISTIAQTVLNLAGFNETATAIVENQVAFLVNNTFVRLFDPRCREYTPPEECELVLSGGVMRHAEYQKALQRRLADRGLRFRSTEIVDDAASAGARYLIERK
ncbi:hypothetical protein N7510_006567 [Penicillium lagena]|uniref:uncharacterized protein n=1 Tax=Penicillium lagena TaxID=94218 RepID=UPI0025412927|nr:uncharacterized protein N7510_006567 [Penicillium lagena]KAJ5613373.1 hypothetical protein N7510_006567 [Penicillium lagena]